MLPFYILGYIFGTTLCGLNMLSPLDINAFVHVDLFLLNKIEKCIGRFFVIIYMQSFPKHESLFCKHIFFFLSLVHVHVGNR